MAEKDEGADESAALAALKEKLLEPKGLAKSADGKEYPVCVAEAQFKAIRNQTAALLRVLDPEAHATYKKMKTEDGGSLAARRKAYLFVYERLLVHCYCIAGL